jgi:tripartite-type tricarboxylate transporter receptor subunit TctC
MMELNPMNIESRPDPVRRTVVGALAALPLALTVGAARAQEKYPSKPIRMIVPGAPGLALDIVARITAEGLTKKYGQAVVVENRPGASGMIGMQAYAKMPNDGYSILASGLGLHVLPPAIFTNVPIDPMKAFVPVAQLAESANILVVRGDFPANNVQELVAAAKAKPGELKMGSNDLGSSMHLAYELFAQRTGTKWTYAPYRGPSEVLSGLLSGTLDAGFSSMGPFVQMIKAGRIKAMAVTTAYRQKALPDVATMQEAGLPDFDVGSWLSLHALPGTRQEIVDQLSRDVAEVLNQPEVRAKIEGAGYTLRTLDAREFQKKAEAEYARWSGVAKTAGLVQDYRNRN